MRPTERKFEPRVLLIATVTAAATLLLMVAVPQWLSKQARLDVLRMHVGQIARIAASTVEGDLHRRLLDAGQYDGELYHQALQPLVRFHNANPEAFYVYTMADGGDGRTYFILDTASSPQLATQRKLRASQYMEEFKLRDEYQSDWLQRLAGGEVWVTPNFQNDEYGNFLSGHAPIYDSQGRYSGFVGVDFDTQYYLAQEARFRSIAVGTTLGALLLAMVIGYLIARYHFQLHNRLVHHYQSSRRDELTQLLNRRGAYEAVASAVRPTAHSHAIILVDIDDFKSINDTAGHAVGDAVLVALAEAIRDNVRQRDITARLGGDEFMVFAPNCSEATAAEIAARMQQKINATDGASAHRFSVSMGICVELHGKATFDDMYRRADRALYRAKARGKNRFEFCDGAALLDRAAIG